MNFSPVETWGLKITCNEYEALSSKYRMNEGEHNNGWPKRVIGGISDIDRRLLQIMRTTLKPSIVKWDKRTGGFASRCS